MPLHRHPWLRAPLQFVVAGLAAGMLAPASGQTDAAALCLGSKDGPDKTIEHCTRAVDSSRLADDVLANVLTRRGMAWLGKRDLEHAGTDFDAAIRLNANSSWTYNGRAVVWMQKGNLDQAIADFDNAVRFKPDYAFALSNRGNAWLAKGDADRAIADQDAAIRLAPAQIELAFTARGRAWLAKGDHDRAIADFDAALKQNPNYANALTGRAFARFCQGAFDAAAADFILAGHVRPDADSALGLVIARRRAGRDGKAELAEATKAFALDRGMPPGVALFAGTVTPDQILQSTSDPNPDVKRQHSCAANFQVGEWYLLQGDRTQARQHLHMAIEACDKSFLEHAAAKADLARLKENLSETP